jgi:hypothetical protein
MIRALFSNEKINKLDVTHMITLSSLVHVNTIFKTFPRCTVLTKSAFLLETPDGLLAVCVAVVGIVVDGCCTTTADVETVDFCGMIGVAVLKSAKRRSRSATAVSAGLDVVVVVVVAAVEDKIVEEVVVGVTDVASDFGFVIIMVDYTDT